MLHWAPILFICIVLTGCVGVAKFPTIEPVSYRPRGSSPQSAIAVHSMSPTFSWKAVAGVSSYDLAIWRIGADGTPGELEYYVEGIEGTTYTVGKVLLPGEYYWSVKERGSTVWATASFTNVNPLFVSWGRGLPFRIKIVAK